MSLLVPTLLHAGGALSQPFDEVLETIFVTAPARERFGPVSETHHGLSMQKVKTAQADTAAELIRLLPSAHVPTNSRGESLVYLRSAGERQVAAFFDGALLNVPWDNRFDLGVFPAAIIVRATSASGTLSPQYGVNALGAVALFPRGQLADGRNATVDGSVGSQEYFSFNAATGTSIDRVDVMAALGHAQRDGVAVSDAADLPFNQPASSLRTNTDLEANYAFLHAETDIGPVGLSATLLGSRTARGIAPESDRASGARFWRYPKVQTIMGILSGSADLAPSHHLTGSVWTQDFRQTIDGYQSAAYAIIEDREEDKDRTYGARAILQSTWGATEFTSSINYLTSEHQQRDIKFLSGMPPNLLPSTLFYKQEAASIGLDVEHAVGDAITLDVGIGIDRVDYLRTGDKPALDPFNEPVFRAGLSYSLNEDTRLRAAIGQKSRMPTMRELFGAALNRFLINPDLKPEVIRTAELGWDYSGGDFHVSTIVFGQDVEDTIDQQRVGSLRQRINLEGSWVVGLELSGEAQLTPAWHLNGQITTTRTRRKTNVSDTTSLLAERPSVLAQIALDYEFASGALAGGEVQYTGRAYSMNEAGAFEPLKTSTQINLFANYPLAQFGSRDIDAELFIRLENILDAVVEPQIGLPAPGRNARAGIRIRI